MSESLAGADGLDLMAPDSVGCAAAAIPAIASSAVLRRAPGFSGELLQGRYSLWRERHQYHHTITTTSSREVLKRLAVVLGGGTAARATPPPSVATPRCRERNRGFASSPRLALAATRST